MLVTRHSVFTVLSGAQSEEEDTEMEDADGNKTSCLLFGFFCLFFQIIDISEKYFAVP